MRDPPDIAEILALAETERDSALAARAHAIAARERCQGDAAYRAIALELDAICGGPDRLAASIRRGIYDAPGPGRTRVVRLLWQLTILKLQESNPAFLEGVNLSIFQ